MKAFPVLATKAEMYQNFCRYLDVEYFEEYYNYWYVEADGKVYSLNKAFGGDYAYYYAYETLEPHGNNGYLLELKAIFKLLCFPIIHTKLGVLSLCMDLIRKFGELSTVLYKVIGI